MPVVKHYVEEVCVLSVPPWELCDIFAHIQDVCSIISFVFYIISGSDFFRFVVVLFSQLTICLLLYCLLFL